MRRAVLFLVLLCASAAAAVEAPADIEKWAVAKSERFIVLTEKPAHKLKDDDLLNRPVPFHRKPLR